MIIDKEKIQHRAAGLDLFRVLAALMVLLFHCRIHHDSCFGVLTGFVSMGAIFMSAFFMLSGYVLFLTYREQPLIQMANLKRFYLKRLVGILPLYYVVALLYVLFLGQESALQNLLLLPVEMLGLQSVFPALFEVSHNDGTWFISCLLLAYLAFPLMQEAVKQMSTRAKYVVLGICTLALFWAPLVVHAFSTESIYANPFFRGIEFFIGVLLCSLPVKSKLWGTWKAFFVELIVLVGLVSAGAHFHVAVGNYMLYDVVAIPAFACMVLTLARLNSPRLQGSAVLRYMSAVTYAFFLVQTFNTEIERWIFSTLGIQNNAAMIVISVVLCGLMAVALHHIVEKPCARLGKRIFFSGNS
jgi:peptidoglycan/LPS O-acetylase OafA/YrhL